MYYLFPKHQERFEQLIEMDETHPKDIERLSLFHVITGCNDLVEQVGSFMILESVIFVQKRSRRLI
ncbi:hypothetical protein [Paenibacillus sp. MER 78]|uniref:hypothetical protein n=1 Tax=Paenibacillus sp. MER 78 TaxID=2939571 RepID=UPI0020412B7B|nr:hypothetical protein [Paenibacillus sp. MER 78]MCM3128139.1 hypothetical protein [Paenibacillus sp. MER 78]